MDSANIYPKILQSFFQASSLDDFIKDVAVIIGNPVNVVGKAFKILASSNVDDLGNAPFWTDSVRAGAYCDPLLEEILMEHCEWDINVTTNDPYERMHTDSPYKWFISKLVFRGEVYGSVVVLEVQPMSEAIWRLLPFISNLAVKLLSAEKYNIVFNDSRLYETIFIDLLLGNVESDNLLCNRILAAKLEEAKCFQLMTVPISDHVRASIGSLKHAFENLFPGCWVILYDNHLQILRIGSRPMVNSALQNEKVRDIMCRYNTSVCYSDYFTDLMQVPDLYQRTLRTLKIAKLLHNKEPEISHEEYRFFDMAMSAAGYDNNALDGFLCSKVVEIRNYDAEHGTDYFQTLSAFLQSQKSCSLAAKQLFTHRNTVLYRITRIRELFELDLDSTDSWFQLLYSCFVAAYKDEISNNPTKPATTKKELG